MGFLVLCPGSILADHRYDHRNAWLAFPGNRVGGDLKVIWAMMAIHAL
jgi:hypothetical protein